MKHLLIVEDNYIMRLFLVNYFSGDYIVDAVEKPRQALNRVQNGHFDMVIMDSQIVESGDHTDLKELIKLVRYHDIPNLLLTDSDKSDERIEALTIGAEDTMSKPFNPVELNLRIKIKTGKLQNPMQNVA